MISYIAIYRQTDDTAIVTDLLLLNTKLTHSKASIPADATTGTTKSMSLILLCLP